ncbi:MAG: DUF616 domain-containing protein [Betaproteobacteria bacterium]|nr:MAG: DUF616 domain-containing protein [Betaproteobacteria bacterium]
MNRLTVNDLSQAQDLIKERCQQSTSKPLICYTAVFGDYDALGPCPEGLPDTEFYCFTDSARVCAPGWTVIEVDFIYRDPRRTARLFKLAPQMLFPRARSSVWLDANLLTKREFFEYLKRYKECSFACFRHPRRRNVYEEAAACIKHGKDDIVVIRRQVERYRALGLPESAGLINSSVLLRRHQSEEVVRFQEKWLEETDQQCSRDQISFVFASWEMELAYTTFDRSIERAPGLSYRPHRTWRFYDSRGKRLFYPRIFVSNLYHRFAHLRGLV